MPPPKGKVITVLLADDHLMTRQGLRSILAKAPVRRVVTQNNHVFAVLYAFFKLECLKIKRKLNHFALRAHLYLKAIRVAYNELQVIKAA